MVTIGKLAKQFNISRSTLLYYDKIGLLKPSGRTSADYRIYTHEDVDRMAQISLYKEAGLSLDEIAEILDSLDDQLSGVLERRLDQLNVEMSRIRQRQQFILQLLGKDSLLKKAKVINKQQWVQMLSASGMDEEAMRQWHIEFERTLPEAHRDFLESLGLNDEEIEHIKAYSHQSMAS
ncbi:MAG: MerR family transcriptional regulator [Chloroflexota bacterium]